jgi:hypothetical protein
MDDFDVVTPTKYMVGTERGFQKSGTVFILGFIAPGSYIGSFDSVALSSRPADRSLLVAK